MISYQIFFPLFYILWVKPHYLKKKKKNLQLSQNSGSGIVIEFNDKNRKEMIIHSENGYWICCVLRHATQPEDE